LNELLKISENKYTKEEVLKIENDILKTLEFNLFAPSSLRFLERYSKLSDTASDPKVFYYA
jgi:hypothetical protein